MDTVQWTISVAMRCIAFKLSTVNCQLSIELVGLSGLEPPTSRLSGGRSNRLSYKPIFGLARISKPKGDVTPRCPPLLLV